MGDPMTVTEKREETGESRRFEVSERVSDGGLSLSTMFRSKNHKQESTMVLCNIGNQKLEWR